MPKSRYVLKWNNWIYTHNQCQQSKNFLSYTLTQRFCDWYSQFTEMIMFVRSLMHRNVLFILLYRFTSVFHFTLHITSLLHTHSDVYRVTVKGTNKISVSETIFLQLSVPEICRLSLISFKTFVANSLNWNSKKLFMINKRSFFETWC